MEPNLTLYGHVTQDGPTFAIVATAEAEVIKPEIEEKS